MTVLEEVHARLVRTGSFPLGQRPQPYQDYYYDGAWRRGQRRVVERAALLGYAPKHGESVLEVGSQMGGFLTMAVLEGAAWVEGVEYEIAHVDASRFLTDPLVDEEHQHVHITHGDATDASVLRTVKDRAPSQGIDHLLLLSMGKHVGGPSMIERWVKTFDARHTYIETNALAQGKSCAYADTILRLGGKCIGSTEDRSHRVIYRIDRASNTDA
jgi:hypothetical protein